jgi:hypothetical protein
MKFLGTLLMATPRHASSENGCGCPFWCLDIYSVISYFRGKYLFIIERSA